ncbi:TetR family transcriptional regulator [bacterium]|nr:TetR family transcriptional regulator [bacterium]
MAPVQTKETRVPKFRRRAEARPDEVLDAALQLFAAQGFAHTTVEQVARAAGLSKAAVYLYFPSKTALLAGLIKRAVAPVADLALGQIAQSDAAPLVLIAQMLRMAVRRLAAPGVMAIPALVLREAAAVPEIVQVYRAEVLDRVLPALTTLIARGVALGQIRPVDPELTLRSLVGPVLAHVLLAEVFGLHPEGGLALDRLVENHLTILLAGLAPERTTA